MIEYEEIIDYFLEIIFFYYLYMIKYKRLVIFLILVVGEIEVLILVILG